MPDPARIRKLLVVKLRAVGDVLLSTIVVKNLRRGFPNARLHYLTETPSADILRPNPEIDHVLLYDRRRMSGLDLIRMVRNEHYDLVLDLFGNPRTALLTKLSKAPVRVGYRFRGRSYAYNILVHPRGALVHNTEFNLDALGAIGVPIVDRTLAYPVSADARAEIAAWLHTTGADQKLRIAVNTGGGWYTKRWGLDRFASLADAMIERFDAAVILTWGPGQKADVEEVKARMKHTPLIPPETTLPQLAALLKSSDLVVSNDSGPMHLATAVGTPVLGIYGPTNPILQGPYGPGHRTVRREGLDCLGCNLTTCPIGHPCMLDLSVTTVFDAAAALMESHGIGPGPAQTAGNL